MRRYLKGKIYKKDSKKRFLIVFTVIVLLILSATGLAIFFSNTQNLSSTTKITSSSSTSTTITTSKPITTSPLQIIVLNKQIPSGYIMGLSFDGGLKSGMDVVFLKDSSEKVSIRFTAKLSGTVTNLVIYAFAYKGQPTVHVGVREDDGGVPKEYWINPNAYGTIQLPNKQGFIKVKLQSSVIFKKGQVYHIYVEAAENPLNGTAAMRTYITNGFAQPYNLDDPDLLWNDERMNILFCKGQSWLEQNKWPIFAVEYSDGRLEGQPYSLIAPWVVWGATYVGQTLIPASDYKIGKIAFVISLKSGKPQDNLYYQIRDANNNILTEGIFAESSQVTAPQKWVETILPTSVTLKAGQLYRLIVLSPQTDFDNAYYLYGHEFSYNYEIGYGGLQHQLTSSHNGGKTWAENPDADAVFKITTE